jgi:endonuclease YncB( thermonuclease family)
MKVFGPYPARVDLVHDGDTVYLSIDLGFDHLISSRDFDDRPRLACRVYGINAPELNTDAGKAARDYAQKLLPVGSRVLVVSRGWDKYGGRFNGDIQLADLRDFGETMIEAGHAVRVSY